MAFSLALLALRSVHSSSQGARQVPLKRTVFRHTKMSKLSRESFELAGKLLETAELLLGDLDPKVVIGVRSRLGDVLRDGGPGYHGSSSDDASIGVAARVFGRGNGPFTVRR